MSIVADQRCLYQHRTVRQQHHQQSNSGFLTALFVGLFFQLLFDVLSRNFSGLAGQVFTTLSLSAHFESISRGVMDTRDLIYFLSIIFVGLFLSELSLTKRNLGLNMKPETVFENRVAHRNSVCF